MSEKIRYEVTVNVEKIVETSDGATRSIIPPATVVPRIDRETVVSLTRSDADLQRSVDFAKSTLDLVVE